jgi:hypothetical protein
MYNTWTHLCICIPEAKVSQSTVTIEFVEWQNMKGRLSRLTMAIMDSLLQSLVDGTPQRLGQTYSSCHSFCPLVYSNATYNGQGGQIC